MSLKSGDCFPATTVVGARERPTPSSRRSSFDDDADDEDRKRQMCAWFEARLNIKRYVWDRANEERSVCISYTQVNSKRLRRSYRIPAEDARGFLKTLYETTVLEPDTQLKWQTCSDLTSRVFPRVPTVLWFDLDCMLCKRSTKNRRSRHFKSKAVIETVVGTVLKYRTEKWTPTHGRCDLLYVTRGRTCGMHLFFPQITVHREFELDELRFLVNTRLSGTPTAVDTGCSALPLPLARDHNGLTRVEFKCNDAGRVSVESYRIESPKFTDILRISNFKHFCDTSSPSSSDVRSATVDTPLTPSVDNGPETAIHKGQGDGGCAFSDRDRSPGGELHGVGEETTTATETKQEGTRQEVVGKFVDDDDPKPEEFLDVHTPLTPSVDKNTAGGCAFSGRDRSPGGELHGIGEETTTATETKQEGTRQEVVGIFDDDDDPKPEEFLDVHTPITPSVDNNTAGGCAFSGRDRSPGGELHGIGEETTTATETKQEGTRQEVVGIFDDDDDPKPEEFLDVHTPITPSVDNNTAGGCEFSGRDRSPGGELHEVREEGTRQEVVEIFDDDERKPLPSIAPPPPRSSSSSTSSSSKRLVQTDIRVVCAKLEGKRKRRDSGGQIPYDRKRRRGFFSSGGDRSTTTSTFICAPSPVWSKTTEGESRDEPSSRPKQTDAPTAPPPSYAYGDTPSSQARLPPLFFARPNPPAGVTDRPRDLRRAKEAFKKNMKLNLDSQRDEKQETDIQFVVSSFESEMNYYAGLVDGSAPIAVTGFYGLRQKEGCSLQENRDNCPAAIFTEHVPFVLWSRDYVAENVWVSVLTRYFDEYLNNAPTLYVMSRVLQYDREVKDNLSAPVRGRILQAVLNCLSRFKQDVATLQSASGRPPPDLTKTANAPKQPYYEKCTVVMGLLSVCSLAFKLVTPIFTDLSRVCRLLLDNHRQTLDSLNSSAMSTKNDEDDRNYGGDSDREEEAFDESVSRGGAAGRHATRGECGENVASIGRDRSVLASVLRWNCAALSDQTLWGLFFYYYHVQDDALARIMDEVVHGGLMVTVLLQAYFELFADDAMVGLRTVCGHACAINEALMTGDSSALVPPILIREQKSKKTNKKGKGGGGDDDDAAEDSDLYVYRTSFGGVFSTIVHRYLRPVCYDDTTVMYTETGYERCPKDFTKQFFSKSVHKVVASDVFTRATLNYTMPHGELLLYNTDVMGTVHRHSSCTNNLVLNLFENMYGGCMTYLTRRYGPHLKVFNRFNGDAYLLVAECRHAMNELIRSIDLSYLNLILRQPVVPPVLEADIAVRHMFMSGEQIEMGSFVCLNAMDYVRATNMFTKHAKFSQENCRVAESFLDRLIAHTDCGYRGNRGDESTRFRVVYLFYLLYIFEVLYKIRHAHRRDESYRVTIERLSWELDVRMLLNLFFGVREWKTPAGLAPESLELIDLPVDLYDRDTGVSGPWGTRGVEDEKSSGASARCVNTRPLVSTDLPSKMSRMAELFGKKGLVVMRNYVPSDESTRRDLTDFTAEAAAAGRQPTASTSTDPPPAPHEETDRAFLEMTQTQLEEALYSGAKWYGNCRDRVAATASENGEALKTTDGRLNETDICMDVASVETFLDSQLRVNIDNDRLYHVECAVREKQDFAFCALLPLRVKMMALVLATHSVKRMSTGVAEDFLRKEYELERSGVIVRRADTRDTDSVVRPDQKWLKTWHRLLDGRLYLLTYCRSLADTHFPHNYFVGLQPDNTYYALYNYMVDKPKYTTLRNLRNEAWAKDVCAALNYLLVFSAYDPELVELVELCLRLFLGFEWPGQWAKRIFVWKSNSNAGKSFFSSTSYAKRSTTSAGELKRLCSTSSFKFRMNFANQMIQAFVVGKLVFNCNTLPMTTDHATIQRVALVPLPFWFQKRQSVVDAMLNWTRSQPPLNDYEKNFRRNVSKILNENERRFFIENPNTKNEDDLFNRPNDIGLQLFSELRDQNAKASMFLVQNKTSQVYMLATPSTGTIVSGIVTITKYFCRFRFFNTIKEPVDYSALPNACIAAAQEWQKISQPYFDWKERNRVRKDSTVKTKVSVVYASLNQFAKECPKSVSFFDLKQFFEWDFAEQKIPYYNAREDEYNVRLDQTQE
ncbi:hypothetical protein J6590_097967 [Homalodisca vitripennis]|nr:hypothetical protein J6590_088227 [Homalodisca vitripennis]KAG8319135.1 hypothetical protein J6590_097967 [Homalodisca vitripennis]